MTGTNRLAFDQLLPRIEDAARALTDARGDVVVFHCTANSMEGGKTGEEQILATWRRPARPARPRQLPPSSGLSMHSVHGGSC